MQRTAVVEHKRREPRKKATSGKAGASQVLFFRSLKRALFGKPRKKSMDLLDKWILKKRLLSLFL